MAINKEYESILAEAHMIVNGDRQQDYGDPGRSLQRVAMMWSAIMGQEVKPEQVPLCMIALKISRECHQHKRDNLVDIAGYAELLSMVSDKGGMIESAS